MDEGLDIDRAPDPGQRKRRARRVLLYGEVIMRRAGSNSYRVHIYDVSPDGCQVEYVQEPGVEERVWIKFEGLEALEASVRWTRGKHAGVAFRRPIHPAVFDLLMRRMDERPA